MGTHFETLLEQALYDHDVIMQELDDHQDAEPIGQYYDKQDKSQWSFIFQNLCADERIARNNANKLLDKQLSNYFKAGNRMSTWNKKQACSMLKNTVITGPLLNMNLDDLFVCLGASLYSISDRLKKQVLNDFANKLEEWHSVDRSDLRNAMRKIDQVFDEYCSDCGDLIVAESTAHHCT